MTHFWAGPPSGRSIWMESWCHGHLHYFALFAETHWRMGQDGLRISNAQGGETTYCGFRALRCWRPRSRIRCGHWPCLLFISQTLSKIPARNLTLHMCSSCSNLVNQYKWPTQFQLFISKIFGKSIIWQRRILFFYFLLFHQIQFKCLLFYFFKNFHFKMSQWCYNK